MAVTLQITDGTTTVNLANATGAELQDRYLPVYATPTGDGTIPPDVTEAIPVYVNVTSDTNLASTLQGIAALQLRASLYANHIAEDTPVWFHRKMDGESNALRYLVSSLQFTPNAQFGGMYDALCTTDGHLGVISVTHHPYGEATSAVAASGTDNVSVLGGAVDYTDVVGDVPARMYYLELDDPTITYDRFWFGFRSDARAGGNAGNTVTLWEAEDGASPIADTTAVADATASPGAGNTKMQCDFSNTTTWARRFTIEMSDVTANYANQVGAYVVLARAQVSQDSAQMRLWQHSGDVTVYRAGPVVEVDATVWNWYEMGTCEFPGRNLHAVPIGLYAVGYDASDSLSIEARRVTGSATLDVDCLVLIPCDEYFIEARSADFRLAASADDRLVIAIAPEDTASGVTADVTNTVFHELFPVTTIGEGIPVGDGRLFCCAAVTDAGQAGIYSGNFDVEIRTYPRWIYARG